jgi:hypothetical protein
VRFMAFGIYLRLVRTPDEAVSFNEATNGSNTVPYLHVVCCTAQLSIKLAQHLHGTLILAVRF